MANPSQHKEAASKKPSVTESVQSLIERKKAEKESQAHSEVSQKMAGTQEGVAEVMAGMEKPKERVSERKGETGEKGDIKGGGGKAAGGKTQTVFSPLKQYIFPTEEVMVKVIRAVIKEEIEWYWKRAEKLQDRIDQGGAEEYNQTIAKIRQLKELLSSLFTATVDYLKNLYVKYFLPGGKKRRFDEV